MGTSAIPAENRVSKALRGRQAILFLVVFVVVYCVMICVIYARNAIGVILTSRVVARFFLGIFYGIMGSVIWTNFLEIKKRYKN